jgi:hypothetical protein
VIPWRVTDQLVYNITWQRGDAELRKAVAVAQQARAALCIENVWNAAFWGSIAPLLEGDINWKERILSLA